MKLEIENISIDNLNSYGKQELELIATYHKIDEVANKAMKILREKYSKKYVWCYEFDGLVIDICKCPLQTCLCNAE